MILFALFIYFVKLIGGFLLIHMIWDSRELKVLVFKFFLGAGMGAGISSLFYFLWSWFILPVGIYPFVELSILLIIVIFSLRKESKENLRPIIDYFSMIPKISFLWAGLVSIAILICLVSFSIQSAAIPHGFYDAWDFWNLGARFIYLSHNNWLWAIPANAWDHTDYPLLVALNVADGWSILGSNTTRIPVAFSLFFMLSLIGLLFSSLSISKESDQGALVAIIISSLPVLVNLGSFQYADIELAYFFLATAVFLYLYTIEADIKMLFLAGLFAGFSAWTKNEGNMFVVITLLICILLSFKEKKNLLKYFFFGLAFPAVIIILFKQITPESDLFVDKAKSFQQIFDISRYQLILVQMWEKITSFGSWQISFFLILILYALLVWKSNEIKGKLWIPFCLFSFQFAGYFMIYLITPRDLYWHLDTSLERLIFHILPLIIFWLFNLLPSPREIFATNYLSKQ
jgi:hypothetical protein